jgi:thiamine biosynthesis protein ThiI
MKSVVIHYQEIALKGKNRPWFVARLVRNIRASTRDLDIKDVRVLMGRIELVLGPDATWELVRDRVALVFGIGNFARAGRAPLDVDAIATEILNDLGPGNPATFRVSAKRADKRFPLSSPEIEREVGGRIKEARNWTVNLANPELTIRVEALTNEAFYSFGTVRGAGGLPVGSSGRVACLLSGGIDSPVAAWRMMKRGCRVVLAHFHAFPLQDRSTIDKTRELARILTRWQLRSRLLLIPFGPVQQTVVAACPAPLRVVLYRRFMMRIAEAQARRHRTRALVTGESLGQVASQTLDNMVVIGEAARGAVLRPLVGMDKEEITIQARRIGTFDVSTLPDQDCCQLFVPRHPATAARREDVERAEEALDVAGLVATASEGTVEERFEFPQYPPP